MPVVNGLEVLEFVRSYEALKDTPVIMITAEATKENVLQAMQMGTDGYIVKPFKSGALSEKIAKLFEEK
jgi:two-component system chemotaxis response regulator CheY